MPDDDKRTHIERLNDVEPVVEPLPEPEPITLTLIIFDSPKPAEADDTAG